ncbi:MAG TPA: uroporphyrinogen decarboxylase family protein, partial [Nitrospirota bacterium]|nr:uroporphyrinogen decarboxylase family protein [Nitrospirota bacterium]
ARLNGYRIADYVSDGGVIAESQLAARAELGYDILFAFADLSVEAEALGCVLQFEADAYPSVVRPCARDAKDALEMAMPDTAKDGRMPVVLDACRRLRESVHDDCVIAACVMGPVSIASQIMGLEPFLYLLADSSQEAERVLDITEKVALVYGTALMRAGAHCPVVFDPIASPAVIPPSLFFHHEGPRLKRLFDHFSKEGSPVSWISIAGDTRKILPTFRNIGVNLATLDYEVPLVEGFRLAGGIAVNGNLKPYSFVTQTPEEIKHLVKGCLRNAGKRYNFILGSGCEVPVESRRENLRAFVDGLKEYRREARA